MTLHYVTKSPQRRLIWGNWGVLGFEDLKTWTCPSRILRSSQAGGGKLTWLHLTLPANIVMFNLLPRAATVHQESSRVLWISKWLWFFDSSAHLHARNFRRQFINHSLLLLFKMTCARNWWSHDQIIEERILKVSILCLVCMSNIRKVYFCKCITPSQDRAYKKVFSFCVYSYCFKARKIVVLYYF